VAFVIVGGARKCLFGMHVQSCNEFTDAAARRGGQIRAWRNDAYGKLAYAVD